MSNRLFQAAPALSEIEEDNLEDEEEEEEEEDEQEVRRVLRLGALDIHTVEDKDCAERARDAVSAIQEEGEGEDEDEETTVNTIDAFWKDYDSSNDGDDEEGEEPAERRTMSGGFRPMFTAERERRPSVIEYFEQAVEVGDEVEAVGLPDPQPPEIIEQTLEYDALGNVVVETIVEKRVRASPNVT